ncbi:MAG TPA: HEAT repeat domain-containing protein [Polyangia bacterium]|jgi:hypothetical protein
MRVAVAGSLLLIAALAAAAPDPVALAERALDAAAPRAGWRFDEGAGRRLAAARLDEARLMTLVEGIAARCPAGGAPCEALGVLGKGDPAASRVMQRLLEVLGELGSRRAGPLLWRLAGRGVYGAEGALHRVLEREAARAAAAGRCAPPTAAAVAAAERALGDFLEVRAVGGRLVAARPAPAALADLAYLLAAIEVRPEVGVAPAAEAGGAWHQPGPLHPGRVLLADALERAKRRGDPEGVAAAARAYLESLGYPGPIRAGEEHDFAWGGPRFAYVMRDLALAAEYLGRFDEAAGLYRRANPGGGACGSSVSYRWQEQVQGAIRAEEGRGRCRAAVLERLLAVAGWDSDRRYGPARLTAAGFDVARLYRGALVTANRDADPAALQAALAAAPPGLRQAALARLAARGPEALERRVFALEGAADTGRAAALPVLLAAARAGVPAVAARALAAVGELAQRPEADPCRGGIGFGGSSNVWRRAIRPLGRDCATRVGRAQADALARDVVPWLADRDPRVRDAAAAALGQIGSPVALGPLRQLLANPGRAELRRAVREAVAAITNATW